MSPKDLNSLEEKLAQSPLNWELRLSLIQAYVINEQPSEAKKLVRDSPDEAGPAPPVVQFRLHRLMTEGRSAAEEFAREDGDEIMIAEPKPAESSGGAIEVEVVTGRGGSAEKEAELELEELSGGAEGLIGVVVDESETPSDGKPYLLDEGLVVPPKPLVSDAPLMKTGVSRERQMELDNSRFVIESAEGFLPLEREPAAGRKMSAFSFALMTHIMIVFVLGFIVVAIPRVEPPRIVAINVSQDQLLDVPPRRVEKLKTPDRSAASAQATFVISSTAAAPAIVPDFEETAMTDVAAYLTDVKAGLGMSLEGEAEESDVNFFGIQSGGRKIAFIVDATPTMLVDEKGGMFAYDKVKAEVGSMLASLNRGTSFNILLYEGNRMKVYNSELIQAKPSNLRLAIEWLEPLNRNYENLGLGRDSRNIAMSSDNEPIIGDDISGYAKAVQVALEMDVNTIFCIAGGYLRMNRSPTQEMMDKATPRTPGTPGTIDPKDRERWNKAVQKTRDWLNKENEERAKKGRAPKVVINFGALVRQITGETPPRARGGTPGSGGPASLPPYAPEDIEDHVKNLVKRFYRDENRPLPQLNLVLFLGKGEDIGEYKDHFRRLTRRNRGKLKILEGLEALQDVTAGG